MNGKPVLFVYNGGTGASCAAASTLPTASAGRFYLDLKVFSGYKTCGDQPDSWHQYGPANAESWVKGYSFAISPGFYKANETTPRLARDPSRWEQNVKDMVASGEQWQLIATFNEWGEGTSVEPATEWSSTSGLGTYLDTVRRVVGGAGPAATTTDHHYDDHHYDHHAPVPAGGSGDPVVAAAGDIACNASSSTFNGGLGTKSNCRQKWTSDLLSSMQNLKAVLPLGDVAVRVWRRRRLRGLLRPVVGTLQVNHPLGDREPRVRPVVRP